LRLGWAGELYDLKRRKNPASNHKSGLIPNMDRTILEATGQYEQNFLRPQLIPYRNNLVPFTVFHLKPILIFAREAYPWSAKSDNGDTNNKITVCNLQVSIGRQ